MIQLSPHALDRPLSTNEAIFHALNAAGGFLGTQVALVQGPLTLDLLEAALRHLQERHPVLRARIVGAAVPRWITPPSGPPPLFLTRQGTDPIALAEAELHRGFRVEVEPLWRCTVVPTSAPDLHHLILSNHHALADGRSAWRIMADLLATCGALRAGTPLPPFLPAGPSLDELLPRPPWSARVHHRMQRILERARSAVAPAIPPEQVVDHRRSRLLPVRVPAQVVAAVLDGARARGATFTGALAAAVLRALAESGPEDREVRLAHAVSMRELTSEPVAREQVGCFAANLCTQHDLERLPPLWELAATVSRSLRQRLGEGEVLAGIAASRQAFPHALAQAHHLAEVGRLGPAALSNRGVLPVPETAPFEVRSWCGATGNHALGDALHLSCSTVRGELCIGLVHVEPLLSRGRAEVILQHFLRALSELAEQPAGAEAPPARPGAGGPPPRAPEIARWPGPRPPPPTA